MNEEEKAPEISYEVRVKPGRAGSDENAPDWEVLELENGEIAGMWRKKKEEAETVQ